MYLLILIWLWAAGVCQAVYWQKLTCPYEVKHESLPRVWCRQNSTDCCSGLTFSHRELSVDGGKLKVSQGSDSFTVALLQPSLGEGVYWCGVLSANHTFIKLSEGYFHSSSSAFLWSITRWILLCLLPIGTIVTNVYSRVRRKHTSKKAEELYDDIAESRFQADPLYENPTAIPELDRS